MEVEGDDVFLEKKEEERFVLKKGTRAIIILLLFISCGVLNMTMSIFKAASVEIAKALLIRPETQEIFSFVFNLGQFISTISLMLLFRKVNRKLTVLFSLFTSSGLLMLYEFTENQMILMPCQFFLGFDVMAINIYIIMWIDQFAPFKFKTVFLAIINIFKALGVNGGLLLNHFIGGKNYKISFLIESLTLLALGFLFVPFSNTYFSSNILVYRGKGVGKEYDFNAKTEKKGDIKVQEYDGDSLYRIRHSGGSTNEWNILYILFCIVKNKVYMSGWFASIILAISTAGFNSWVFNFFNEQNGDKTQIEQLLTKSKLSLSGPLGGAVVILLLSLFVGNYFDKSTPVLMFIFYSLTTICGNLIPDSKSANLQILYSYLFFIGSSAQIPYLQGVNLSGGTPSRKPFGILCANAGALFLGTIPGPKIYQYCLRNYSKEDTLKIFMRLLFLGMLCNFSMMYHKCKLYSENEKKQKEEEEKSKEIELSSQA